MSGTSTTETQKIIKAAQRLLDPEHPMGLRHLYYLLVQPRILKPRIVGGSGKNAGKLETGQMVAKRLSRIMTMARKRHLVSYESLTDGLRDDIKPSSWAGIIDYTDTVRDVYRKDLWQAQPDYIEFAFEKQAIIGTVEEIGVGYDVKLRPLHGQDSTSHMYRWAKELSRITKPIFIYYAGDHDASGYAIENSAQHRLKELLKDEFGWTSRGFARLHWERFAFLAGDFKNHNIPALDAKPSDPNYKKFKAKYGTDAAELDALPPDELRSRMEGLILKHLDVAQWRRLQEIEHLEKESWQTVTGNFSKHWRKKTGPSTLE
jgi:hypothetical protein